MNKYIRTNIDEEIIGNYELLNSSLKDAQKGSLCHWKLSLLLIHVLLQNVFVKSLHCKSCFAYMKMKPKDKQPYPGEFHEDNYSDKILNFKDLYKEIKKQNNVNDKYDRIIDRLNDEIRNHLYHYDPKLIWSISIELLKEIFIDSLEIINMIIEKTNNIPMDINMKNRLLNIVKNNREIVSNM